MKRTITFDRESSLAVMKIANENLADPVAAVRRAGLDFRVFFEGFDWSEMDFRESDLSKVSFRGAILDGAYIYQDQLKDILRSSPKSTKHLKVSSRPAVRPGVPDSSTSAEFLTQKLDPIDMEIIKLLQDDGRRTSVEMAASLGVSSPSVLQRLRRLEENGVIKGYWADIDPERVGVASALFIMVRLEDQSERALASFEESCEKIAQVRACSMLNGEIDFLLKCVIFDEKDGQNLVETIAAIDGVMSVKSSTSIGMGILKPGIPIDFLEELKEQRKTSR